uniref:Uncharacterized protein n=1 Tax=Coccidioides posadasii RMSCC 3488 TaxID=454284 RepID=A0A0J6FE03_COCPO|nr:hypothetical protein CPAG_07648 [Coccidioides posadasii RMSCC 3488]
MADDRASLRRQIERQRIRFRLSVDEWPLAHLETFQKGATRTSTRCRTRRKITFSY